jgi:micrococcal nuclease
MKVTPPTTPVQHTPYYYNAVVASVYDGDTCKVDIDLGLGVWVRNEKIRLCRINAPELRGADKAKGVAAAAYLKKLVLGRKVTLQTFKDFKEKYGRYLGELWLKDSNVSDMMVAKGHAKYQEY